MLRESKFFVRTLRNKLSERMQGHSFRTKDVLVSVRTELIEDLLVKQVVDGAELIFPVLHRGQEAPEIREEFVMDFLGGHGVDNHIALYNHGGLE